MHSHSASERSVGYVFLMRARVANHFLTHPFRTVSETEFSEVRPRFRQMATCLTVERFGPLGGRRARKEACRVREGEYLRGTPRAYGPKLAPGPRGGVASRQADRGLQGHDRPR